MKPGRRFLFLLPGEEIFGRERKLPVFWMKNVPGINGGHILMVGEGMNLPARCGGGRRPAVAGGV